MVQDRSRAMEHGHILRYKMMEIAPSWPRSPSFIELPSRFVATTSPHHHLFNLTDYNPSIQVSLPIMPPIGIPQSHRDLLVPPAFVLAGLSNLPHALLQKE